MPQPSLSACLDFLYGVQKERGLAALYLCSRGQRGGEELNNQFAVTDACAAKIEEPLRAGGITCEPLIRSIQALPPLRTNIMAQHVLAYDVIEQYTQALVLPALGLANNLIIRDAAHVPGRVSALLYLLNWQERLSREREMVTQLAGQEWMHDEAFVSRLKHIIRERQAYERLFWGVTDETQQQTCAALKTGPVKNRAAETPKGANTHDKYSFFSLRIDALQEAAQKLAAQLVDESAGAAPASSSGQALDSDIEGHYDIIKSLPLFRGLSTGVLQDLLRTARLVHHDKGSIFVTQGEISGRFHIILDGWVKIYKSTAEGEESILQILGRRDYVLGTDIMTPAPAPISAKAVTRIKLLSIPASVMRDHVARQRDLALNMLAASARRAQKMINHFEQLTLRSASQRVGNFLLNQCLETGIGGPPIVLPFDKSLIAAYLGIKPETFSRILQNFRASGFRIERSQITLPESHALCDYCDADTTLKCDLAGTASCPRVETREAKAG